MANLAPAAITLSTGLTTWTNQPSALTEFLGGTLYRCVVNLSLFDTCRLTARVNVAGAAGAVLGLQYSSDGGTNWTTLCSCPISATGDIAGGGASIPAGAQSGDVVLRLGGQGGNGVADPAFGLITLQLWNVGATMERAGLIAQITQNVYGLTRDMRDNANGYISQVNAGQIPVATIAATMVADANAYLVRLGWMSTAFTNNLATMTAALNDIGLTVANAQALDTTLTNVANHTKAASLTTGAAITTEANFILANVPGYVRLW